MNLDHIKQNCLVFDIETYAQWPDGREISIQTNFDEYVANARCKWFGAYSYKYNKTFLCEVSKDYEMIKDLLEQHSILIGFNNIEFDYPILINNGLANEETKVNQIDCMRTLGASTFKDKKGFKFAGRGVLMGYKFKNNSLQSMSEAMKLEYQKSSIDYHIFKNDIYTADEIKEIKTYLKNDVLATKGFFDKLWEYWIPFTDLIDYKYAMNLSWIKSTIASLIYKSACFILQTDPTFSEHKGAAEEMGGNVIDPKLEEAEGVWYLDFTSLYPHIFCMFNLFAELIDDTECKKWNGNDLFKVKGTYKIDHQHMLSKAVQEKLIERNKIRKENPNDPMVYTLKIWLNGLYGVARSKIFEKVYTPNCGWDCCWLGQQIQEYSSKRLQDFGFETIYGDTDSIMVIDNSSVKRDKKYVQECLKTIIDEIKSNVPFPSDTFEIKIEKYLKYIMFPFSNEPVIDPETGENKKIKNRLVREFKGKKKNYAYIYEEDGKNKIEIVGLPIKKDNATPLGMKIFHEILEPIILKSEKAKFDKQFIDEQINNALKNKSIMELLAVEYKVKEAHIYKKESQIHAQISKEYFNGQAGVISLIKNNKIGKVGKGTLYCTIEEAVENKLTVEELDLDKIYNELEPFIKRDAEVLTK